MINLRIRTDNDRWNIWKPRNKGNGRTFFRHHQNARRPVQQHCLHGGMAARIVVEGHCAHRRMLWFLLLSFGAEEADRWVLAPTTWFIWDYTHSMARYTACSPYIVHQGHGAPRVQWNHFDSNIKVCEKGDAREQIGHWNGYLVHPIYWKEDWLKHQITEMSRHRRRQSLKSLVTEKPIH